MGQTIWPLASENQQYALANVPKLTSFLSILGSCYIIADICRLKRRNTYHRIILGMNVMDLMSLVAWFFTTWPIPVGTEGVVEAKGNQQTCDAQGFFSQLSIATVLYNVCLAIYFMLVIRHGWTEKKIAETRLEYYFHMLCIGIGIGTAVAAQVLELYNPAGWQCWITPAPVGCAESWEWNDDPDTATRWLEDADSSTTGSATTDASSVPCERGGNANLYVWFLFYLPLWVSIIVASSCLYQVYAAYHRQDLMVEKWRQKLMTPVIHVAADATKIATDATKMVAGAATTTTSKLSNVAKRPFVVTPTRRQSSKRKRTPVTTPTYTPAQKRKLMQKQRSQSPANSPTQLVDKSSDSTVYHSTRMEGSSRMRDMSSLSLQGSVASMPGSSQRVGPAKGLPPVLGSRVYTGRTNHPKLNHQSHQHQQAQPHSKIPMPILRRGKTDETTQTTSKRKQQNAKSKLVTTQALLYLCSFYVAWLFPSVQRIQESTTAEGVAYYHWMFLSAFFCPLQGLMNFIVYIRPKYIAIRREKKRIAAIAKQQKELAKLYAANSYYRTPKGDKNTVGTIGTGSSSALMTIISDEAIANSQELSMRGLGNASSHHSRRSDKATIVQLEGMPSSDEDDHDSVSSDEDLSHPGEEMIAVWTEADLGAKEAGEDQENEPSIHEEALTDLFDALTTHEGTEHTKISSPSRPTFFRSNSSESNLLSMRNADSIILTDHEILSKFHNSINYDSQGHVSVGRARRQQKTNISPLHNSEHAFQSSWTKNLGKNMFRAFRTASSSMSSSSNHIKNENGNAQEMNDSSNSLSFPTSSDPDSFATAQSTTGIETINSSGTFLSAQSSTPPSTQSTARSPSSLHPTSAHSCGRRVSFAGSNIMETSILEESSDREDDASPPARTSNPHPIEVGVRKEFENFRRSRQDQKRQQQSSRDDDDQYHDSVLGQQRISMDMISTAEEKSRRTPRPVRRFASDSRTKKGRPRRTASAPTSSTTRRPNDMSPTQLPVKGVTWHRSPVVRVHLDSDGGFASSADDIASSDGGDSFYVGISAHKKMSRRDMMKKAKHSWKSSKKGAQSLVKGGKSGIKSIKNFASTFKEALQADAYDDWATAITESEVLEAGDMNGSENNHAGRPNNNHSLEVVDEPWRESNVKRKACEEEKEEIEAFGHMDSFEQERDVSLPSQDAYYEWNGSHRSLNSLT